MTQTTSLANWSGTASARPTAVESPTSEDEVATLLGRASARRQRVKPVGALHSFNDIAMTDGVAVSLDNLSRVLAVDADRGVVRVQAGIRLKDLILALDALGLALPNRGSIAEQSVAGAISTGTHGSAPGLGNLASLVTGMRLVTPDGTVHRLSRRSQPKLFSAAKVGLGALGVITEATLRVVPSFSLAETVTSMPYEEAADSLQDLAASHEFVKMWWLPTLDRALVFSYERTDEPSNLSAVSGWVDQNVVNRALLPVLWNGMRVVPQGMHVVARAFAASYFRPRRTVGKSYEVLGLAMPPTHREAAWSVPMDRAGEAMRSLKEVVERDSLRLDMIQEFRFVAADDAWLSPTGGRDSFVVGAITGRASDTDRYFAAVRDLAGRLDGRPHWGKEFDLKAEDLAPLYPHWEDFRVLRGQVDPTGTMRNNFLDRVLPVD